MSRYKNGQVPDVALSWLAAGTNADGYWEHLLPPATVRKHLALVLLGEQRRGRTLRITPGWNGYRPLAAQRTARTNACARGRCGDAATEGTSSHGGEYQGADAMAIDYGNWAYVWGTQAAFYAACREVGLDPGVFSWEPWHVIDRDPWAPSPAGEESKPDGVFMSLSDQQQNDLVDRVEGTAKAVARIEQVLAALFRRGGLDQGQENDIYMRVESIAKAVVRMERQDADKLE